MRNINLAEKAGFATPTIIRKEPEEDFRPKHLDPIKELEKRAARGKCAGHPHSVQAEQYMSEAILLRIQKQVDEYALARANNLPIASQRKVAFNFYAGNGVQWLGLSPEAKASLTAELARITEACTEHGIEAVLQYQKGDVNSLSNTKTPARVVCAFSIK